MLARGTDGSMKMSAWGGSEKQAASATRLPSVDAWRRDPERSLNRDNKAEEGLHDSD